MPATRSAALDFDKAALAAVLGGSNQRIRNLLAMIEAAIGQTHAATVEDYRARLMARISSLQGCYQPGKRSGGTLDDGPLDGGMLGLAQLLEQTLRPYSVTGAQVAAAGPDLELEPKLAFAMHLAFDELAANASKCGALSSPLGRVAIEWKVRKVSGAHRQLAILWTEHGGPAVKGPRHQGFGLHLIKKAFAGYGTLRLDFGTTGFACLMLIDLGHAELALEPRADIAPSARQRMWTGLCTSTAT